jgi:hypothetical protein
LLTTGDNCRQPSANRPGTGVRGRCVESPVSHNYRDTSPFIAPSDNEQSLSTPDLNQPDFIDITEVNKLKSPQKTLLTIQKANHNKGIKTLNKRINPGAKISKFKELTNSLNSGKSKADKINISAFYPYFKEKGYTTLKSENSTIFIVDSTATCHIIANKNLFINYLNKTSYIN